MRFQDLLMLAVVPAFLLVSCANDECCSAPGQTHRALLVAHVREGNRTTDLSAWQGLDYADAWTGEAPPVSQALGPYEVRLYLTP